MLLIIVPTKKLVWYGVPELNHALAVNYVYCLFNIFYYSKIGQKFKF